MKKHLLLMTLIVFLISACTGFSTLTPVKKQLMYRSGFNHILMQFNSWAVQQPEEVKIKLRSDVVPLIDKAASALDNYEAAYVTDTENPQAKLRLYIGLKNDLVELLLKYGLKVEDKEVSSDAITRNTIVGFAESCGGHCY